MNENEIKEILNTKPNIFNLGTRTAKAIQIIEDLLKIISDNEKIANKNQELYNTLMTDKKNWKQKKAAEMKSINDDRQDAVFQANLYKKKQQELEHEKEGFEQYKIDERKRMEQENQKYREQIKQEELAKLSKLREELEREKGELSQLKQELKEKQENLNADREALDQEIESGREKIREEERQKLMKKIESYKIEREKLEKERKLLAIETYCNRFSQKIKGIEDPKKMVETLKKLLSKELEIKEDKMGRHILLNGLDYEICIFNVGNFDKNTYSITENEYKTNFVNSKTFEIKYGYLDKILKDYPDRDIPYVDDIKNILGKLKGEYKNIISQNNKTGSNHDEDIAFFMLITQCYGEFWLKDNKVFKCYDEFRKIDARPKDNQTGQILLIKKREPN